MWLPESSDSICGSHYTPTGQHRSRWSTHSLNTISLQLRALTPARLSRSQFILSVNGGSKGLYTCCKAKSFSDAWSFLLKPQLTHDFAQLHVNVRLSGAWGSFTIQCGLATAPPLLSGLDISFCSGPFSVHSAAPSGRPHPMSPLEASTALIPTSPQVTKGNNLLD